MSTSANQPQQIIEEAERLIASVQRQLDDSADLLASAGVDLQALARQASPADVREAESAFRADMEAVEREVQEENTRRSFSQPVASSGAPRMRRSMI